jgi:hypothetical protein
VVEGTRLESVHTPKGYRGFESLSLRQSSLGAQRRAKTTAPEREDKGELKMLFSDALQLRLGRPVFILIDSSRS